MGDVWGKFNSRRQVRDARGPGRIVDRLELNEVLALRDMLLRALTGTRFCETNFEYLIHLMDKTFYYLQSSSTDQIVQLDALTLAIEDTFRKQFPKTERDGWRYVPFLSREVILETVLHAWNELKGSRKDEVLKLHRKFLKNAAKKYDQVRVYSLNYDPLLLEAIQPLSGYSTGFPPQAFQRLAKDVGKNGFGKFSKHTWFYGKGTEDFYDDAFDSGLL